MVPVPAGTRKWITSPTRCVPKDCTCAAGSVLARTGFWQPCGCDEGPVSPPDTSRVEPGAGQERNPPPPPLSFPEQPAIAPHQRKIRLCSTPRVTSPLGGSPGLLGLQLSAAIVTGANNKQRPAAESRHPFARLRGVLAGGRWARGVW